MKEEAAGKGAFVFIAALCVSLTVLAGVFLLVALGIKTQGVEAAQSGVPAEQPEKDYSEENLSWVILGCRRAEDPPGLIAACYYDAEVGALTAVVVPPETVVTRNGRTDTIIGHYEYEGTRGGVNAVRTLLGGGLLRYFRIQQTGIANLADFLGGVDYTLAGDIVVGGETFLSGEQLLDGRRLAVFLFDDGWSGPPEPEWQADLLGRLLTAGLSSGLAPRGERMVEALLYNCETNLGEYDLRSRNERFCELLKADGVRVEVLPLEGSYNPERTEYTPDAAALARARALFPEEALASSAVE